MKPDAERTGLDRLLKRAAAARRRADRLAPSADRADRLCLLSELADSLRALETAHAGLRERIAKTRKGRTATAAYGRAAALRFPHR